MTLSEFIKTYREEHGLSQRQFANGCGLSNGYIAMLERGVNPGTGEPITPSLSALKKIATGTGVAMATLLSEVEDLPVDMGRGLPDNIIPMPELRSVPRLGTIACGTPILAEQNVEGFDQVPDFVKCDFTLKCKGDSMVGARVYDGDVVCIKEQPEVENGQIAAVLVDGEFEEEATLKRVRYIEGGVALWPENPQYAPLVFTGKEVERVHIVGLATHFISRII